MVEARGDNVTKAGLPYNNNYCFVFRLAGGKLAEVTEYMDTELVTAALASRPRRRLPPQAASASIADRGEQPMADAINFPGTVEWSRRIPDLAEGYARWAVVHGRELLRVCSSPHGRGHALMLMMSPQDRDPPAARGNFCFNDNEKLARYLVSDFVAHFGAWKDTPGLHVLIYRPLDSVATFGDTASTYSETVKAGDLTISLTWRGLGKPFCFALPPEKSATGKHSMPSPVRPLRGRLRHAQRQDAAGKTCAARDGRSQHIDGVSGVLGNVRSAHNVHGRQRS